MSDFLFCFLINPVLGLSLKILFRAGWPVYLFRVWITAFGSAAIFYTIRAVNDSGGPWGGPGFIASGIVFLIAWWILRRKGRKRAPRAYGAKSRALIQKLVRKARETRIPRPVLRPVPQGA